MLHNLRVLIPTAQLPAMVLTNDAPSVTIGGTNVVAPLTVPPEYVPAAAIGSLATGSDPESVAIGRALCLCGEFQCQHVAAIRN